MAKTKTNAELRITTVQQLRQTIAARVESWRRNTGYSTGNFRPYLAAAGLDTLLPHYQRPFVTVDMGAIVAKVGGGTGSFQLDLSGYGEPTGRNIARALADQSHIILSQALGDAREVSEDAWTVREADPDAIDPQEFLGQEWGQAAFPAPVLATKGVQAEMARIVAAVLDEAERNHACNSVENALRDTGFGEYLPAQMSTVVADVPGFGAVEFQVENSRSGEPRADRMAVKIRQALSDKLDQMLGDGTVSTTITPVTA